MKTKCICAIRRIYKAIGAFEIELERLIGLNINEAMLLCLLSDKADLTASEIAEEMGLTKSNASKVISSLEQSGYVKRCICKEDGRSMRFHLTKKGIEQLSHVHCDQLQLPPELQILIDEQPPKISYRSVVIPDVE
jgi:DNA-binding MarR family transcriptional regulator